MEKRVLLAVTLSFLVLALYQYLFVRPVPRTAPRPSASGEAVPGAEVPGTAAAVEPAGSKATSEGQGAAETRPVALPEAQAESALVGASEERQVEVVAPELRAVFTNRGAQLLSWQLTRYLDSRGRPVDLVPAGLPESEPRPFAIIADDPALTATLSTALFLPSATRVDLGAGERELAFEYRTVDGLVATKRFEFGVDGSPYVLRVSVELTRGGEPVSFALAGGPGLGDIDRAGEGGGFLSPTYYQKPQGIYQRDGSVARLAATSFAATPLHEGTFTFVGADDHYFLSALLPDSRRVSVRYRALAVPAADGPRELVAYTMQLDGPWRDVRFFLGPKQFDLLRSVHPELVRTIHFGMFDWLVVPLLQALNWLNRYIGNYGWSIVALTAIINLLMWPLRHRSMVSMKKMQALQPQVKAIQDRYAHLKMTDPARQKMNTELMNLYREKGVNPASGCVPMLLTLPVLIAFYSMLSQAIELRGAPFVGWITDLSARDPFFVTPLLMGASMVWQQRMTPSTADPVQQKVFMIMPALFTVMFLWAPSGLVIYWFVSNLFAIGQQILTNRMLAASAKSGA